MRKINNYNMTIKRIMLVLVLALCLFGFTSCKGKTLTLQNASATYASGGNYSITNQELWDTLKWGVADDINTYATEAAVYNEMQDVKNVMSDTSNENYSTYISRLTSYMLEDIYGFSFNSGLDVTENHEKEYNDLIPSSRTSKVKKYAENAVLNYSYLYSLNAATIESDFASTQSFATIVSNIQTKYNTTLLTNYYLSLAKENYAKAQLQDEINKANKKISDDNTGYFTQTEIIDSYKENYLNQGEVKSIILRFASEAQANSTLKVFGLKVYNDEMYFIVPETSMTSYQTYSFYYDNFDFTAKKEGTDYIKLSNYQSALMMQIYIGMYNYINGTTVPNLDVTTNIVGPYNVPYTQEIITLYTTNAYDPQTRLNDVYNNIVKSNQDSIIHTKKDINNVSSSLYDYVYSTLKSATNLDTSKDVYSISAQNYDSFYYMAFKLDQDQDTYPGIYYDDISDDDLYNNIKNNTELYNAIQNKLFLSKVTSSSIDDYVNEIKSKVKISIFDKNVEIAYLKDNSSYSKTLSKTPDGSTIYKFKYNKNEILVSIDDVFKKYESISGTTTAYALLLNKAIKDTEEYKNSNSLRDTYKNNIEYTLANFASDGMSSDGYSASLGKYNFLMLYYHYSNIDDIIDNYYRLNYAKSMIINDFTNTNLLKLIKTFSSNYYTTYFSLGVSQIVIYTDKNLDGINDPWDSANDKLAINLLTTLTQILETYTAISSDNVDAVIKLYNESSIQFNNDQLGYDFSQYHAKGFLLKKVDATITNTSTDQEDAVMTTAKNIFTMIQKENTGTNGIIYPSTYVPTPAYNSADVTGSNTATPLTNSFNGFVVTSISGPTSAKFESANDKDGIYTGDLNYLYNNKIITVTGGLTNTSDDSISLNQVQCFIYEYLVNSSISMIPTDLSTTLINYVKPVLTRFQDNTSQLIMYQKALTKLNITVSFTDANNETRFKEVQTINQNSVNGYDYYATNQSYNPLYNWFTQLQTTVI